ncbi:hypothetical protein K469DRAFT_723860 [Zopfia rhizophila CBS 207.26]|uniref:BCS1 N-terminal domain-containing protein n=1 Tax=Zopfia rhizophila CBS 207.26 TaxID=1314779 RepID=A0A6A6DAY1_9PEZI|nr:hypothetical protein K469DRAFT_723860 [Zopfia rhizophila CBS 207.26]
MPLLDFFFPSLAPATSSAWPLLTSVLSIYGRLLCICGLLLLFGKYASEYLEKFLETYFSSKIKIPYTNKAYDMLIFWVCFQPFARSARTSLTKIDLKSSVEPRSHAKKKSLHYLPCNSRLYFWHKHRLFVFNRQRSLGKFSNTREEACISYFRRNPAVLRELLNECRRYYLEDRWKASKLISKKEMSTIIINRKLKEMLLCDITKFLDSKTRTYLCLSIAGHFNLDVYVLTISSLNDYSLKSLFTELPQHCIILLKDVNATANVSQNGPTNRKVSLLALLNVLDGLASSEGRLLIMTTNHIKRLDPALIRPSRVDMKKTNVHDNESERILYQPGEEGVVEDYELLHLRQEFIAKVPKLEFSPAKILSFLLANKHSPHHAIANIAAWIEKLKEERTKLTRITS